MKKTDKIDVIFDADMKYKNTSLKKKLQKEPDLLNNLGGILLRFRKERYCMTPDGDKMLHKVLVREQDKEAMRFL